ncbi:hypothetical protein V7S43_006792 [Phytophthora oleae]|uniref:Uncharacterized protein n=1 Tax=Phytophthora oleae TaxID=2107226 RepID=A0ABD3FQL7_9STRA
MRTEDWKIYGGGKGCNELEGFMYSTDEVSENGYPVQARSYGTERFLYEGYGDGESDQQHAYGTTVYREMVEMTIPLVPMIFADTMTLEKARDL